MFEKIYRPALLTLLTLILFVQIYGLYTENVKDAEIDNKDAKCAAAAKTMTSQIKDLSSNYQDDIYNNPRVDNINQQMLVNNEYQFLTQVVIAEMLVACQ